MASIVAPGRTATNSLLSPRYFPANLTLHPLDFPLNE